MSTSIETAALPFSVDKQKAVLGYILYDHHFFSLVIDKLEPGWFSEPLVATIYSVVKAWYEKWRRQPSIPEILDAQTIREKNPKEIQQIQATIALVKTFRETFHSEPLLEEMGIWLKARIIQLALPKAAQSFNKHDLVGAVTTLNSAVKDFHEVRFNADGESFFTDFGSQLLDMMREAQGACTFGLTMMDRILLPDTTGGGLAKGDVTLMLGATNAGKTSVSITIAAANIMQGRAVLFLTHEGRDSDIKLKIMRCMTGLTNSELLAAYANPEMRPRMQAYEQILGAYLTYVPMQKPGLTVEEVAASIERYQDRRRLSTGKGYDLLIDDYPAKLTTNLASKGNLQLRERLHIVYDYFVQMSLYHEFATVVNYQSNREGSRVNNQQGLDRRLLRKEDASEAFGPIHTAANVITINRSEEDADKHLLTFLVDKQRTGITGVAVVCTTDYERTRTHGDELGAFSYRGENSLGNVSVHLMANFRDKHVDSEKLRLVADISKS